MNTQMQSHLFWGINSPLTSLTGITLLLTASGRISFALICTLALLWVYVFVMTAVKLGGAYFPLWGRNITLLFLSSLAAEIFLLLMWILDPRTALESAFFVFLVPLVFMASGLCGRVLEFDMAEIISQSMAEALILGMLILGLAMIREPLGFGSVSVPGMNIARFAREEPLRFFQASSGALILLGYGTAVYRYYRNRYTNSEDD